MCIAEKQDWTTVQKFISSQIFSPIYVVTSQQLISVAPSTMSSVTKISQGFTPVMVDFSLPIESLNNVIVQALKTQLAQDKNAEFDLGIYIGTTTDKISMAFLSALLKTGYGIRLIAIDETNNVIEL